MTKKYIHRNECTVKVKIKLSHYTPMQAQGGEEIQLLLILDIGTRRG
jgi:hypothetical protein